MKKRTYQIALIALFLVFNIAVTAQENFLSGTVLMASGEEVEGFIDYRNWDRNPEKVAFKKTETSETIYFRPIEIRKFLVADEIYISAIVDAEASLSARIENPNYRNPKFEIRKDTVFLQALFEGDKSLYQYKDKDAKYHFYFKYNESYKLLLFKTYILKPQIDDIRDNLIRKNEKYKGQLISYFNDCQSLIKDINRSKYDAESIRTLFGKYYNCSNMVPDFEKQKEKTIVEFGPIVGLSATKIGFSSGQAADNFEAFLNSNFPLSFNPTFGMFFEARFTRNQGKISLNNEILFTTYRTEVSYSDYENEDIHTTTSLLIGYSHIKLNSMLRYRHPIKANFIFMNGGFSIGIIAYEENYSKKETTFYTIERIEEGIAIAGPQNLDIGISLGVGTQWKDFRLEARFERSVTSVTEMAYLSSSLNRAYLLVSYKIR